MSEAKNRTYSRYTTEALTLMAVLIRTARIEKKMSTAEVAMRAGISRSLLQRVEKGDPGCSVGVVFELAAIVGVPLFTVPNDNMGLTALTKERLLAETRLRLLPERIHTRTPEINDDF